MQVQKIGKIFWVGKIPWRRKWQPTELSSPGKSQGQRSLVGCSPWGHKESDVAGHSTGARLTYNTVVVSALQPSGSAKCIHTSPLFWICFLVRSPPSTESSSLCYTVGSHQLLTLYSATTMYTRQSQFPNSSHHSPFFLGIDMFVLYVCLYFCSVNKIIYTGFSRFHIYALTYNICFRLITLNLKSTQPCLEILL